MLGEHPIHPVLLAKDLAAAREFYHDRLGLEILTENDDAIVFRCGDGTHLDVTRSTVGTADEQTQVSWQVHDLRGRGRRAAFPRGRGRGLRHARPQDRGRHRRPRLRLVRLDHRPGAERPGHHAAQGLSRAAAGADRRAGGGRDGDVGQQGRSAVGHAAGRRRGGQGARGHGVAGARRRDGAPGLAGDARPRPAGRRGARLPAPHDGQGPAPRVQLDRRGGGGRPREPLHGPGPARAPEPPRGGRLHGPDDRVAGRLPGAGAGRRPPPGPPGGRAGGAGRALRATWTGWSSGPRGCRWCWPCAACPAPGCRR